MTLEGLLKRSSHDHLPQSGQRQISRTEWSKVDSRGSQPLVRTTDSLGYRTGSRLCDRVRTTVFTIALAASKILMVFPSRPWYVSFLPAAKALCVRYVRLQHATPTIELANQDTNRYHERTGCRIPLDR